MLMRGVKTRVVFGVVLAGVLGAGMAGGGGAWGQEGRGVGGVLEKRDRVAGPRSVDEAVGRLGADEWAVREAAQRWLLGRPAVVRSDIEQKLEEATDREVTGRLEEVALHLYLKGLTSLHGRASMLGIRFSLEPVRMGAKGEDVRMGVAVLGLEPGFPAAEILQVGDRVVGMAGQGFGLEMTVENFRSRINGLSPGDAVELLVLRGKEELKVAVTLAGVPDEGVAAMTNYRDRREEQGRIYAGQLAERVRARERGRGRHDLTVKGRAWGAGEEDVIWVLNQPMVRGSVNTKD